MVQLWGAYIMSFVLPVHALCEVRRRFRRKELAGRRGYGAGPISCLVIYLHTLVISLARRGRAKVDAAESD